MTEYAVSTATAAVWATSTHREQPNHGTPYLLRWGDICEPGKPASQRLSARFRMALIRLEELLYALYGARPQYGAADPHWAARQHPRCLWGPEQWKSVRDLDHPDFGSAAWEEYFELGALGESAFGSSVPSVPIRSRSGDPNLQYLLSVHDPSKFPLGSVWRSDGAAAWDHRCLPAVGGLSSQTITINYRPPEGVTPVSVTLVTNFGAWTMTQTGGVYSRSVAAHAQNTLLHWYLRGVFPVEGGGNESVHEPQGTGSAPPVFATPPEDPYERNQRSAYTCRWFTHHNPYGHGLPEFMHWLPQYRKGTDEYRFDSSETIDRGLINLCRFVLDWLVKWCDLHHNPRIRGEGGGGCCFRMPIRWYWTGGSQAGLYRNGGKGGAPRVRPLHNLELDDIVPAPSSAARKSWRGLPMVYRDPDYYANYWYGQTESWLPAPDLVLAESGPGFEYPQGEYFQKGLLRGLRADDVIDPTHIEEIIAAIDYLVDYGCWMPRDYCSTKLTPLTYRGHACGTEETHTFRDPPGEWEDDYAHAYCEECCQSCENGEDGYCIPWPKPTYEACTNPCSMQRCNLSNEWEAVCLNSTLVPLVQHTRYRRTICESFVLNCGYANTEIKCAPSGGPYQQREHSVHEAIAGWSKWVCAPLQNPDGPDALHGNGLHKQRWDHAWHPNTAVIGPSNGNRYGDIEACGEFIGDPDLDDELWFGTVTPLRFNGIADPWQRETDCGLDLAACGEGALSPYPAELPGLGAYKWGSSSLLCESGYASENNKDVWHQGCSCSVSAPACWGNKLWVAVDLNLDGAAVPFTQFPAQRGGGAPHGGDRIPKLYDYDLAVPPAQQFSDCPCETWTGPATCE